MPASCNRRTAAAAVSGVCSAGLATTALPAASAAATWPVKIASGKFHGEMQAKTPRPCNVDLVALAGWAGQELGGGEIGAGAQRVIAQAIDRFAQFGDRRRDRAPALADDPRDQLGAVALVEVGGVFEDRGALPAGRRSQAGAA